MSLNIEDLARVKVYSASRHEEEVRDAPASVSVITAEEIRRYGWRTLGEVLGSLRGFYTSYDRNYTYLGVRGFLRPGDYNSRILLLIDGHRLNDNVYGSAEIGTEFPLDLDLIDRIEVVRGPGSSLFGTNAVFGVINIITRRPAARFAVETSGDVSSFLSRTGRITAQATADRWSGLLSGTLYESAGPSRLFFPEFASPATNGGLPTTSMEIATRRSFRICSMEIFAWRACTQAGGRLFPRLLTNTNFDDPGPEPPTITCTLTADYTRSLSAKTDLDMRGIL